LCVVEIFHNDKSGLVSSERSGQGPKFADNALNAVELSMEFV
jgi:hypothetical protein